MTLAGKHSRLRVVGVAALTLAFLPLVGLTSANAATTDEATLKTMTAEIYQAVNPSSNANLLTSNLNEIKNAEAKYGFTDVKGSVFKAAPSQKEGTVPVYRLFKNGDFMWVPKSSASNEFTVAQEKYGYVNQGINFYASTKALDGGQSVYRFQKSGKHRYATTDAERTALTAAGWQPEGISFYAAKTTPVVTPTPPVVTPEPTPTPEPATPPVVTPPVVTPAPEPTLSPADADGKFSLAVIPDTQQEVGKDSRFINRTQWLVANRDNLDLRHVVHTGDVVNWDTPTHDQYEVAAKAMRVLDDAKLPSTLTIGNHDTAAVGVGGSAADPKNTRTLVRNTTTFNSYFNVSRHPGIVTFEDGKIDNSYQTFDAAGEKFLVLSLELWPRVEAVNWAKDVVASHPDYNVVVSTHAYLNGDASISTSSEYGSTSGKYLYDNLISQYPNIKVVLSGHVGEAGSRVDTGVNGNKIVSLLGTFHSNTTNPVRTLEFDVKNDTLTTKFFGPSNNTTWAQYDQTISGLSYIK
jgi:hypothetical protein